MEGENGTRAINPFFRTAVAFWGQSSQVSSSFVPKRDCGSKGVNGQFPYIYMYKYGKIDVLKPPTKANLTVRLISTGTLEAQHECMYVMGYPAITFGSFAVIQIPYIFLNNTSETDAPGL